MARYRIGWSGEWLRYGDWLAAPRESRFVEGDRLLFRESPGPGRRIQAALCRERAYYGHAITPYLPSKESGVSPFFLLGLANSKLLSWYAGVVSPNFGKLTFPKLNPQDIKALPVCVPTIDDSKGVTLAKQIAQCAEQLQSGGAEGSKNAATILAQMDTELDQCVYRLYGLSPEQVAVVENWGKVRAGAE